jgi:GT2 family glycosyltransferase
VILHFHRERVLRATLDCLRELPVDEVIVVDNGSTAGLHGIVESYDRVRLIEPGENLGIAGRNLAARAAHGEILVMLDDDSYPLAGAVEAALEAFASNPRIAVVGGLVRDVDEQGRVTIVDGVGSFDWFLRAGRQGPMPPGGFPTYFFPEGASFIRRDALLAAGGFYEPFVLGCEGLELTTRLIAGGWEVHYAPTVVFNHERQRGVGHTRLHLYHRIRNNVWYFWLHFPAPLAARRIPAYLMFDLIDSTYRREPGAWVDAVRDAWRKRGDVRGARTPLPRDALRRAELHRGRMHLRLLAAQARRKLLHR